MIDVNGKIYTIEILEENCYKLVPHKNEKGASCVAIKDVNNQIVDIITWNQYALLKHSIDERAKQDEEGEARRKIYREERAKL